MNEKKFTIPVILFILGTIISFGSFIFALLNMGFGILNALNGKFDLFVLMFVGHIVAMIGMAIGGLFTTVGTYLGGWTLLKSYILPYLSNNTN